jgi:hypothetical protein
MGMENKKISLIESLNKANIRRKYYLHHRLKNDFKIHSRQLCVIVTEENLNNLSEDKRKYLNELRDQYHYNIQFSIPN